MPDEYITLCADDLRATAPSLEDFAAAFGGGPFDPDVVKGRLTLRIGRCPCAFPLRSVNRSLKRYASEQFDEPLAALDYWLIIYTVGIQDTGDWRNVARFGLKVWFEQPKYLKVVSVFPETQMLDVGQGSIRWSGAFNVTGAVQGKVDPAELSLNPTLSAVLARLASVGAEAQVDTRSDIALGLSFKVLTPLVVSTGINDNMSTWTLTQAPDNLLLGDQIVGHVIGLRKPVTGSLILKAQIFADIGLLWVFTQRFVGVPLSLSVPLDSADPLISVPLP